MGLTSGAFPMIVSINVDMFVQDRLGLFFCGGGRDYLFVLVDISNIIFDQAQKWFSEQAIDWLLVLDTDSSLALFKLSTKYFLFPSVFPLPLNLGPEQQMLIDTQTMISFIFRELWKIKILSKWTIKIKLFVFFSTPRLCSGSLGWFSTTLSNLIKSRSLIWLTDES